ncbi:LamG domain-containing protein [candidate division WOR-3 bacterium]|nr:LamG domain-containing protein [candidate division WOR-3 bacterium]
MTEVKKPTTFTEGALLLWANEANCYDQQGVAGDETTYGYQTLDTDETPSIRFHTWETKGQTYTATTLKLKWKTSIQTGDDEFGIEYTKNGGSNWYDLVVKGANRSVAYTTAQIALDANQDLTQVEVRVNSDKVKGADNCQLQISDIWTEGEYTGGVTVSPAPASAASSAVIGAIILGLISITPATASAVSSCINPAVVQSSLAITPASASVASSAADPSIILGNISIAPTTASAASSAADPIVIQSNLTIAPASANVVSSCVDPVVVEGGGDVVVTPAPASVISSAANPTVILGSITIIPTSASAISSCANPVVIEGGDVVVTPEAASVISSAISPAVILGNISITPTTASATSNAANPTVILGNIIIIPSSASVIGSCIDPTVVEGGGAPGYVTDGLLCYWKMDETGGVVLVDNEGNVPMNLNGNYTLGVEGKKNTAVEFEDDGVTSANSADNPSTLMNLTAFSIEFLVKMYSWEDLSPYISGLVCIDSLPYHPFLIRFGDGSIPKERLQFLTMVTPSTAKKIKADSNSELNTWYHVICTWDGDGTKDMKMYIDKQLQTENGPTSSATLKYHTTNILRFAQDVWLTLRQLDGVLDEIRIYDRALTQTEVDQNYYVTETPPDTEPPAPPTGLFVDTPPARPSRLCIENPNPAPASPTGIDIEDPDPTPARPAGLIIEEV